jgi:hypothetical protein
MGKMGGWGGSARDAQVDSFCLHFSPFAFSCWHVLRSTCFKCTHNNSGLSLSIRLALFESQSPLALTVPHVKGCLFVGGHSR